MRCYVYYFALPSTYVIPALMSAPGPSLPIGPIDFGAEVPRKAGDRAMVVSGAPVASELAVPGVVVDPGGIPRAGQLRHTPDACL